MSADQRDFGYPLEIRWLAEPSHTSGGKQCVGTQLHFQKLSWSLVTWVAATFLVPQPPIPMGRPLSSTTSPDH